jgi:hypothetical protein
MGTGTKFPDSIQVECFGNHGIVDSDAERFFGMIGSVGSVVPGCVNCEKAQQDLNEQVRGIHVKNN